MLGRRGQPVVLCSGFLPTANTRNIKQQLKMAADDSKSLEVARRMFARRFPDTDLKKKSQRNDGYGRL